MPDLEYVDREGNKQVVPYYSHQIDQRVLAQHADNAPIRVQTQIGSAQHLIDSQIGRMRFFLQPGHRPALCQVMELRVAQPGLLRIGVMMIPFEPGTGMAGHLQDRQFSHTAVQIAAETAVLAKPVGDIGQLRPPQPHIERTYNRAAWAA
ncbi:hypothetical protein L535_3498 [Bordetella bronchiseptica SBL-F6116]|nr:hypothetical protein L489_3847 [Bordetella bronchiseptica 00-P-2730]KDE00913.1 hypothetical protein L535_3498 [Bordetella bronchiseptica SBL-F6116]